MKTSNNQFYNPEAEFRPMDFSLWAHPEEGSAIKEEEKSALAPTSTSPVMNPTSVVAPARVNAGGIDMPAPQAAPLPRQGTSNAVDPNQSVAGKLHDKLRNVLTGEAPQGYESILSPEEIQQARPSLSQSIFLGDDTPSAGGAWKHNLDKLVATKQQSAGIVANQQMAGKRAAIEKALGTPPEDSEGFNKWLKKAYGMYSSIGDVDTLGKLNVPMQQVMASETEREKLKNKPLTTEWEDVGGEKVLTNKETGAVIARMKKTPAPKTPSEVDATQKNAQDQQNKILDDYARDTKDFHQVMGGWDVLKGATKDPSLATPFAVTDAYARITNPGGIVRPTTMEMIDHMGSIGQRMRKWWEHNANGALPPDIMDDFKKTLYNIVHEHKVQFDQIRSQAILRGSRSGVSDIQSLLQNYEVEDPTAKASPADNFKKWGVTNTVRKP